ncbi:MAG: hypothetical protein VX184_03140 [Candidatus Thermoplasmatota archaeon]|nr:hypothetical protein [Candidatus Thermoplasmatota archaeon]MEE3315820.1 hypothetical protein [Candidatus Thermoplasmatota archaeon]
MTRKHSISLRAAKAMRITTAAVVALLLSSLTMTVSSSESSSMWDDARLGVNGGTVGAIAISLGNGSNISEATVIKENFAPVVEVYTATWCMNCVYTENSLDEAIGDTEVFLIHYHRHKYEALDPFGSNSTEHRWESTYGDASYAVTDPSNTRNPPSNVFFGERLHIGMRASSSSLVNDFATSLATGTTSFFTGPASFSTSQTEQGSLQVSWDLSGLEYQCMDGGGGCPTITLSPWVMFIEDSAYYPDGTNGLDYYHHVLHEAHDFEGLNGSSILNIPAVWDGDDLSVVLLIDWSYPEEPKSPLPAPGVLAALASMLVAAASRRQR